MPTSDRSASGASHAASSPPAVLSSRPNALALAKALRRRWLLASSAGVICAALAAVVTWFIQPAPKFTALTLMRVPPEAKLLFSTGDPVDLASHQKTQVSLVKSRFVLNAALRSTQTGPDGSPIKLSELSFVREQTEPVEWLEKQLQADFSVAPDILRISISGDKPDELVPLVTAIRHAYREDFLERESSERRQRFEMLGKLKGEYEDKLRTKRDDLNKLAQGLGSRDANARALLLAFAHEGLNAAQRDFWQTESDLRTANLELTSQKANERTSAQPAIPEQAIDDNINNDQAVQALRAEVQRVRYDFEKARQAYTQGEKDPKVQLYRQQLASKEEALAKLRKELRPRVIEQLREKALRETSRSIAELQRRVRLLEDRKALLDQVITRMQEKVEKSMKNSVNLEAFRDDMTQDEEFTKKIASAYEALKVEIAAARPRATVLEDGYAFHSSGQNRFITVGMAALGGLAFVLLAVSWWEFRARRIGTPEEVIHGLGIKLVGAIPDSTSRRWFGAKGARQHYSQQLFVESVDATRTMLLEAARAESVRAGDDVQTIPQVVLVTSARPGEGKTSLATHLAASLAQIGYKTLFIDADLRNPTGHRLFNLEGAPGFSELLRGDVELADVVQATSISGLWMIPAGQWDSQATRALAQPPTGSIIRQLRETFDFLIIDSSPVLPVVDPLLLSKYADMVLLSVLCDVSRLQNVYAAHQRLTAVGVRMVRAVMSGVREDVYTSSYHYLPGPEVSTSPGESN